MILLSLRSWGSFDKSFQFLFLGWVFALVSPIMVTMIPTRLFVDWEVIDPVVSQYTMELSSFFGNRTEDWAQQAIAGCDTLQELRRSGQLKKAEETLMDVCSK